MAVNQLSLNQIIQYFASLGARDQRINTFGYGPIDEVSFGPYFATKNITGNTTYELSNKTKLVYPLMWVSPEPSLLRRDSIVLRHKIYFLDLVEKDNTNQLDVYSDCLRSAQEIKAFIFKDFFYDIFPSDESTLTPITDEFDDEVTGYILDLELQLDWLADVCSIPGLYPSGVTFNAGPGYFNVASVGYLPLAGGQLTGPLTGTSAYFDNYFSGGTNLNLIFSSIEAQISSATTQVQPGLNTYTGGTILLPTVNISAATLSYISATTISGSSFYSGSTPFSQIFSGGSSSNLWSASTGFGSIIANNGTGNVSANRFSIVAGQGNRTLANYSVIGGGYKNFIDINGNSSVISGGRINTATTIYSVIGGGYGNLLSGLFSTIAGGYKNSNLGYSSFIGGGKSNYTNGNYGLVVGGKLNSATTTYSIVVGGTNNLTSGLGSFIGSGTRNIVSYGTQYSSIVGGSQNIVTGSYSSILGGYINNSYGSSSIIVGGGSNKINANYSVIVGGASNYNKGVLGFIGGGKSNSATTNYSIVIGGQHNISSAAGSVIIGGGYNRASGPYSIVGAGFYNLSSGNRSGILAGASNSAVTNHTFIGSGLKNFVSGPYSSVVGGYKNYSIGSKNFIGGGFSNSASSVYSIVVGGKTNNVSGQFSTVLNGTSNVITGARSGIGAGSNQTLTANDTWLSPNLLATSNISGGTFYSGSTPLSQIFLSTANTFTSVAIQNGLNTYTGGTATLPTINISAATLTSLSAISLSGANIYSGSVNLNQIFLSTATTFVSTAVQAGSNIVTGGTQGVPIISLAASPSVNNITASGTSTFNNTTAVTLSAGTISGGTFYSGKTPLSSVFLSTASTYVQSVGSSGNITTGGTASNPTIGITTTPIFTSVSATTISGGTLYSGSTPLSQIFLTTGQQMFNSNGLNTYTGGTTLLTSINISAATLNNLAVTGNTTLSATTASSLSASTLTATTSVFTSGIRFVPSAATGYIFTSSNNSGDGYWAAPSTLSSGATELAPAISILCTPPTANTVGDTYLVCSAGTGAWSANSNNEATYVSGTTWTFVTAATNNTIFITSTLLTYLFNGTSWSVYPGVAILQNGNFLGNTMNIGTLDYNSINFKISGNTAVTIQKPTANPTGTSISYLIVGGGGGGGSSTASQSGGGGGGGGAWITGSTILSAASYSIVVGAGGTGGTTATSGLAGSGFTSTFLGVNAIGGGGGGNGNGAINAAGLSGGSGGGAGGGLTAAGGARVSGQGFSGGTSNGAWVGGAGGGGGSQVGQNAQSSLVGGTGGTGFNWSITNTRYAGGGGGGSTSVTLAGGSGGGGFGANGGLGVGPGNGGNGTNGFGGGGGGAYAVTAAGSGGSGTVIISYPVGTGMGTGGTISYFGGNVIHTFTSNGTFSFLPSGTTMVGIGTTPTAELDVQGSNVINAALRIRSGQTVANPNNGDIWNDGTFITSQTGFQTTGNTKLAAVTASTISNGNQELQGYQMNITGGTLMSALTVVNTTGLGPGGGGTPNILLSGDSLNASYPYISFVGGSQAVTTNCYVSLGNAGKKITLGGPVLSAKQSYIDADSSIGLIFAALTVQGMILDNSGFAGDATPRVQIDSAGCVFGRATALLDLAAPTANRASLRIRSGSTNPGVQNSGDLWNNGDRLNYSSNGLVIQELPQIQQTRVLTNFNKTTDTTLSAITSLSAHTVSGKNYMFTANLHVTADAVGGSKFAIQGSGATSATSIIYQVTMLDNTSNLNTITSRQTTLGGSVGQAGTTTGWCKIEGFMTMVTGGVIVPVFGQNASNGTSIILTGSTFVVQQIT
jgi:hypothetical protein